MARVGPGEPADGGAARGRPVTAGDTYQQAAESLFGRLSKTWPSGIAGRLKRECTALHRAEAASLPYMSADPVQPTVWITMAPTSQAVQAAVADLRAWVLPSLAWEHPTMPFVSPEDAKGTLAPLALALAPEGYFRWHSSSSNVSRILDRLAAMRRLSGQRPIHSLAQTPSLLELRQQFAVALLTGDHDAAVGLIEVIDREGLDSALNTQLMRLALRDRFREFSATVDDASLEFLLRSRVPPAARAAIIRAFHGVYLAPLEVSGDVRSVIIAYGEYVHGSVSGLLGLSSVSDGPEIARTLAYRSAFVGDLAALRRLTRQMDADPATASVLQAAPALVEGELALEGSSAHEEQTAPGPLSASDSDTSGVRFAQRFRVAQKSADAAAMQAIGLEWLTAPRVGSEKPDDDVLRVLQLSLQDTPNAALRDALGLRDPGIGSQPEHAADGPSAPQTWAEFSGSLTRRAWNEARTFLASSLRPDADLLSPTDLELLAESLDDLYTTGCGPGEEEVFRRITVECTRVLVDDLIREREFPRAERVDLYMRLLRLWGEARRGSANTVDGHVVLTLAEAVLERAPHYEAEVAELVNDWWKARPYRALLPYALEATELLASCTSAVGVAQGLWIDAVTLSGQDPGSLTRGELLAWRRLARAVAFDEATADEYFRDSGFVASEEPPDVLSTLSARVAIVSLREPAARVAAAEIEERTGRPVDLVTELVAGKATAHAKRADVVLFVWSASKHAVFRAFDDVRERLVYVPGTGASSIVLALERWAAGHDRRSAA